MIHPPLSKSAKNFISLFLFVVIIGFALGATHPMMTLTMYHNGFSDTLIGAITSCAAVASILAPILSSRTLSFMGIRQAILYHTIATGLCIIVYPFLKGYALWFIVRFFHSYAINALFTISEYYINTITHFRNRGKVLGLYITFLSAGFSAGPLLLFLMKSNPILPYFIIVLIMAIALVPITLLMQAESPLVHEGEPLCPPIGLVFGRIPHAILAGVVYGAVEIIIIALAPLLTMSMGYEEDVSALVLTFFALGNILFQLPVGILCQKISPSFVLLCLTSISALCMLSLVSNTLSTAWFYAMMFILGGSICGLYTTALIIIGNTFTTNLVGANATFAAFYSIGSFLGPFAAGSILETYAKQGLILFITSICVGYSLFLVIYLVSLSRPWSRRS